MIHANKRGARVRFPLGQRWKWEDSFAVIVWLSPSGDKPQLPPKEMTLKSSQTNKNSERYRTADSSVWEVDTVAIAVKNTHLWTWINYISSAPGGRSGQGRATEPEPATGRSKLGFQVRTSGMFTRPVSKTSPVTAMEGSHASRPGRDPCPAARPCSVTSAPSSHYREPSTREFFFSASEQKQTETNVTMSWKHLLQPWRKCVWGGARLRLTDTVQDEELACGFWGQAPAPEELDFLLCFFEAGNQSWPFRRSWWYPSSPRCRTSLPFFPFTMQRSDVRAEVFSSVHGKNAIEASQRAHRTSKATLNPKSYFPMVLLMKTNKV